MTEQQWLTCSDPTPMLVFLRWTSVSSVRSRTSDRKILLFACACCSEIEEAVTDERSKEALSTARRFADGNATLRELNAARTAAWEAVHALQRSPKHADPCADSAARAAAYAAAYPASRYAVDAALNAAYAAGIAAVKAVKRNQVSLLRDIIGNPFQPVTIDRRWLTPNVVSLAQSIYNDQAFINLPSLGDASTLLRVIVRLY